MPEDAVFEISISYFCVESAGFLKMLSKPSPVFGKCGLSKNASVESDTSISVESAGSQKIPC